MCAHRSTSRGPLGGGALLTILYLYVENSSRVLVQLSLVDISDHVSLKTLLVFFGLPPYLSEIWSLLPSNSRGQGGDEIGAD